MPEHPAQAIARGLASTRLPLNSEREMQDAVERWLTEYGWNPKREFRLSATDRVDFMAAMSPAGDGVAIEIKLKGSKRALVDQLMRYAKHLNVTALAEMYLAAQ